MAVPREPAPFKKKDFVPILEFIQRVHKCPSIEDLKSTILSHLIPILGSSAHFFSCDHSHSPPQEDGEALNFSESIFNNLENQFDFCRLSGKSCPLDCPFKSVKTLAFRNKSCELMDMELREHLKKYLKNQQSDHPCSECLNKTLKGLDHPEPVPGMGFHRLLPDSPSWTLRDLGILNLVWPDILQTVNTLVCKNFTIKFQNICAILAEASYPLAILTRDFFVLYRNRAFDEVIPLKVGQKLPDVLSNLLGKEIKKSLDPLTHTLDIPFYTINQGFFRLSFRQLDDKEGEEIGQWLLRITPLKESDSELHRQIDDKPLTSREREICFLLTEGKSPKEIASRLFISYHTTRNHLKSIHKKLGVGTRAELITILNR